MHGECVSTARSLATRNYHHGATKKREKTTTLEQLYAFGRCCCSHKHELNGKFLENPTLTFVSLNDCHPIVDEFSIKYPSVSQYCLVGEAKNEYQKNAIKSDETYLQSFEWRVRSKILEGDNALDEQTTIL